MDFRLHHDGTQPGRAALVLTADILRELAGRGQSADADGGTLNAKGFSSAQMFDAALVLRTKLVQNDFPAITSERGFASLTHAVAFFASPAGFIMRHQLHGARGTLNFHVRHDGSAVFTAHDYETHPYENPRWLGVAQEFSRVWREEGDDALFARLSELYRTTMPERTMPAYLVLSRERRFRDWLLPDDAEGLRKPLAPGVYRLQQTPPPPRQYAPWLQVIDADQPGRFGGSTLELRGLEEHDPGAVSLIRVRTHYHWLPERDGVADAEERERRAGQPFTIISFTGGDDGRPDSYHIQFADGFVTIADLLNVEYI